MPDYFAATRFPDPTIDDGGLLRVADAPADLVPGAPGAVPPGPPHAGERGRMSLRHGVAWAAVGNATYLASQYAVLALLAKFTTPEVVGEYTLALAVATPVAIVAQLQLRQLLVTDRQATDGFGDYALLRGGSALVGLGLTMLVALAFGYHGSLLGAIGAVGASKAVDSLGDLAQGKLQWLERLDVVARSLALRGVLGVTAVFAVLRSGGGALAVGLALAAAWLGVLLAYDLPQLRRLDPGSALVRWRPAVLRDLLVQSLPLGAAAGVASLGNNVPRYFLEHASGLAAVAAFSVASVPVSLCSLLTAALSQASLARAASHYQEGRLAAFRRIALAVAVVSVGAGLAAAVVFRLFGHELMTLFFTREYVRAVPLTVIMALAFAAGGLGSFGGLVLAAGRHFRLQAANVLLTFLLQLPVAYLLVRQYGDRGAAWSEVVRFGASGAFLALAGGLLYLRRTARPSP